MLFAWAIDSDLVQVWDVTANTKIPPELRLALKKPDVLLYTHNSYFDRTVLNHAMPGIMNIMPAFSLKIEQVRIAMLPE